MAVTVVQGQKSNQVECYRCKAVLQYTFSDIKAKMTTDYAGGRDTVHYIPCPLCGTDVTVNGSIK